MTSAHPFVVVTPTGAAPTTAPESRAAFAGVLTKCPTLEIGMLQDRPQRSPPDVARTAVRNSVAHNGVLPELRGFLLRGR